MPAAALRRVIFGAPTLLSPGIPDPGGGGSGGSWDAATKHADLVIEGAGNLAARNNVGGAWRSLRATTAITGKKYFEFLVDVFTANMMLGICESTFDNTTFLSNGGNDGAGYQDSGNVWNPIANLVTTEGGGFADNGVVGVAVDEPNDKIWWTPNGTNWYGSTGADDPAAGTGGCSLASISGTLYPGASIYSLNDRVVLNMGGSAFTYTPPSGFTALETGGGGGGGGGGGSGTIEWDATWTHADFSGAGSDTIAKTGSSWRHAITDMVIPASAKKCFEIVFSALTSYAMVGIDNKTDTAALNTYSYQTNVMFQSEGSLWQYGSHAGNTGGSFGSVVVGVYVDTTNNKVWFTTDNSTFFGLPGASSITPTDHTTGAAFGAAVGGATMYPAASADASVTIKIRSKQSDFTLLTTPVTGYTSLE